MRHVTVRILVVDDSAPWRRFVSTIAQKEPGWHVVAEVADGLEAVQKAKELTPDVVLLDIGLPILNGIEAARQIRKVAPNSKILFVSAYDDLDIVEAALDTGASGYVVKADAGKDLARAVEAVFQGKRFVSSRLKGLISEDARDSETPNGPIRRENLTSSPAPDPPRKTETTRCHEVQFYSNDALLLGRLTYFVGAALMAGNAAIVFATKRHRDSLLLRLGEHGVDVDAAIQRGTFVSLDAADVLSTFMVNGRPDAIRFFEAFGKLIASVTKAAKAQHPQVAVFGEGVALLWAEGNAEGVIQLEKLGSDLAKIHKVDILCAYPFSLHIQKDGDAFRTICAEHSAVYVG
jgi:DNA-binding NarL/FixJ family response regulator